MICGDFNARTNIMNDYIHEFDNGSDGGLSTLLNADENQHVESVFAYLQRRNILERYSMDTRPANKHGKQLIDLCKATGMFMLNGRWDRDRTIGKYTRSDVTGSGVIDYVICTTEMHKLMGNFEIGCKFPESDHMPIAFSINTGTPVMMINESTLKWAPIERFDWNCNNLPSLGYFLNDCTSFTFKSIFYSAITAHENTNSVANAFTGYFSQACYRAFGVKRVNHPRAPGPAWFDSECRAVRKEAIDAGAHVECDNDQEKLVRSLKKYRALIQRKKRAFKLKCASELQSAYCANKTHMWRLLSKFARTQSSSCGPSGGELVNYYEQLAREPEDETFDNAFINEVSEFLQIYDAKCSPAPMHDRLELEILNGNITTEEIESAIDSLKNNKAVGIDMVPAEFLKTNKTHISNDLCVLLNYIIELEEFPDAWAEGVRSSIHKSGKVADPMNYRGITVLPIFEKIFEIIVQNRLQFVNECFGRTDRYNGGFLKDSQTMDNLFILQALIERQLCLGQNLIICFVDFSRAFDLMNRNILFYKLIQSGLHGRVINTLRNLYSKTFFRVKHGGFISEGLLQEVGVNQGGNASPIIFRKYLSDLRQYLNEKTGAILADDEILVHLLWADDLIMTSTTAQDAQSQLNGLASFCAKNRSIVNTVKTKYMVFGKLEHVKLFFNSHALDQVTEYKYLGNIVRAVSKPISDIFANNHEYLRNKARGSIFSMLKKLKNSRTVSPKLLICLFDSLVRPILTYGSAIWGTRQQGREVMDKIHLWFLRTILGIKQTSSNSITLGECGSYPPSVTTKANAIIYLKRIETLPSESLLKKSFIEMKKLHELGFQTWYGRVCELARENNINIETNYSKSDIKLAVKKQFQIDWSKKFSDLDTNPGLRTYVDLKTNFTIAPYLCLVDDFKFRNAISKLRSSSHNLEIERGRHTRPRTPITDRLCLKCEVLEDEVHFLTSCDLFTTERDILFSRITTMFPDFQTLANHEKFIFMLCYPDRELLTIVGKFIYNCFQVRNSLV